MCAQGAALNSLFLQVFLYFSPLTFEGSSRETAKKFRLLFRCDGLSVYSAYGMCVLCIVGCRSSAGPELVRPEFGRGAGPNEPIRTGLT